MHQHVSTAIDEGRGCFCFFGWVEPLIDPNHFGLHFRVNRLGTHSEGIDVANHFRNWNGSHNTQGVCFGHLASNHARHVSTFVGTAVVGAQVVGCFVTGGVFKLDFFVVCSHFEHGVHVTKGGAKDDLVALAGQVAEDALGISAFWHFFNKSGDDLVTILFFKFFASVVVCKCPATIAHWANIGKRHLEGLCFRCCRWFGFFFFATGHESSSSDQRNSGDFENRSLVQNCHEISFMGWTGLDEKSIMNWDERVCLVMQAY